MRLTRPSDEPDGSAGRTLGLTSVTAALTAANIASACLGFATGPLLARALGPADRGLLAAIVAPLAVTPWIVSLGLPEYATRQAARGRNVNMLMGSLGCVLALVGLLAIGPGLVLAQLLGEGHETVTKYLTIGFLLLPVTLQAPLLFAILNGTERWAALITVRLTPFMLSAGLTATVFALGRLTLTTAAVIAIIAMNIAVVPGALALRFVRPRVARGVMSAGLHFGLRAWVGSLGSVVKYRLDQLLMIPLTSSRQLGLYVVAVTISSAAEVLTGAVDVAISPRVSQGDRLLAARAVRLSIVAVGLVGGTLALVVPWVLPLLFGSDFSDAVPMTWILLIASIPGQGSSTIARLLTAAGRPGIATVGEVLALGVTIPGLLVALPALGGMGAAIVSLAAYTSAFVYLIGAARRHFRLPLREFLLVTRRDLAWARSAIETRWRS